MVYTKSKVFTPRGVDPSSEGVWFAERQTSSPNSYLPDTKLGKCITHNKSLYITVTMLDYIPHKRL